MGAINDTTFGPFQSIPVFEGRQKKRLNFRDFLGSIITSNLVIITIVKIVINFFVKHFVHSIKVLVPYWTATISHDVTSFLCITL